MLERMGWPLAFFAATVALRVPWFGDMLYDFDSIAFAFALESFDVSVHSPHPPGYLLYVLAGRLLCLLLRDANAAFAWVSALASAGSAALICALGRDMGSRSTGILAALLLVSSPLFWVFGAVCAPYAFSALFSVLIAGAVWLGMHGRERCFFWAALAVGAGGGFRPEIPLVMAPLCLYGMRRLGVRKLIAAALLALLGFALWFVPTVILSRGWGPYTAAVRLQGSAVWDQGTWVNLAKVGAYSLWGLGAAVFFLPFPWVHRRRMKGDLAFLFWWMVPYLVLVVGVSFGQPGMLLIFLPPVILLLARGVSCAFFEPAAGGPPHPPDRRRRRTGLALAGLAVAVNVILFARAPFLTQRGFLRDDASFADKVGTEFFLLSGPGISFSDRYYGSAIAAIRERFPPAETVILTNFKGWPFARYYLRGYPVHNYFCLYGLQDGKAHYVPEGELSLPPGTRQIVLFNGDQHSIVLQDALGPYNRSPDRTRRVPVPGPRDVLFLDADGARVLYLGPLGFSLSPL